MSERLVHNQLADRDESMTHWQPPDEARCWCRPEREDVAAVRAVGAPEGRKDFCIGRGHVIVRWSDDGSPLYICDRCYAELVVEWAA